MRDGLALPGRAAFGALVASVVACGGGGGARGGGSAGAIAFACPRDAVPARDGCRCAPGLVVLEGACVGAREVDAYCGSAGRATGTGGAGGCVAPVCASAEPIDLASGRCAPARTAREIFARLRPIPDDLQLGCHDGRALVVHAQGGQTDGGYVACLPLADTCPRASAWDPRAARCVRIPACAPGELRGLPGDGADNGGIGDVGACVRVVTRGADGSPIVDVGLWSRAMLGANGGEGSARLCRPLSERPWELDVGPGGARTLALTIELRFPDNDVTQVSARVETVDAASRLPVLVGAARGGGGGGGGTIEQALDPLLLPLRALGGAADAASATVGVRCTVRGGGSPMLFPRAAP